jgi:hypothetical protein
MQLSMQQLISIVGTKKVQFAGTGTKRASGRVPMSLDVTARRFLAGPVGPLVFATVTDLSTYGISLVYPIALLPGEELLIFFTPHPTQRINLRCIVRRCRPAADEQFAIGAEFISIDAPEPALGAVTPNAAIFS